MATQRRPREHYQLAQAGIRAFPRMRMPRAVLALLTAPVAGILAALASWRTEIGEPLTLGLLATGGVWLYALLRRPARRRTPTRRRRSRR